MAGIIWPNVACLESPGGEFSYISETSCAHFLLHLSSGHRHVVRVR